MMKALYNAKVYLDRGIFCDALLIDGSRIVLTGANKEILDTAADAERIDAEGCLVLPGFHDSHLHLHGLGRRAGIIDASKIRSIDELVEAGIALIDRLKPPQGAYIQGAGLSPDSFSGGKRPPNRYDLDRISREYPVIISRHCGHKIFCNSKALELAGIADSAPDIAGGDVERDGDGRPSGIFSENANALVRAPIPPPDKAEMRRSLELAMEQALSCGVCAAASYDTGGPDFEQLLDVYRGIYRENSRYIRLTLQCGVSGKESLLDEYIGRGLRSGRSLLHPPEAPLAAGDSRGNADSFNSPLKMGPLKFFADGTLGSQTAWLNSPYHDKPDTCGFPVIDRTLLQRFIQKAASNGFQTAVHVIGDAGADMALQCFESITQKGGNPLRHALIHCQITGRPLLERMAVNRILAMVQPIFLADDMYILESRVGRERASTSYAWATMDKLGIPVSYGTDSPVSPLSPLLGIACAVTRQDMENRYPAGGFFPDEKVDVYTAVDAYTAGSAYACFDEQRMGRIKPGYLADLVLLDRDIFTIPHEEIKNTQVVLTMVGGKIVYRR
ncbi:MAG: amidohydrolase [Treponema sp.]|jgi:predicted amidohydrolase YtcJ|nr:amidohydrolase [Treponema sp.]